MSHLSNCSVPVQGRYIHTRFDHRRFLYCSTYRCSITGWLLVSLDRCVLHLVKLRDWTSGRRNIEGVIVASISIVCPSVRFHSLTHSAGFRLRKCPHRVCRPAVRSYAAAVIAESNRKLREQTTYAESTTKSTLSLLVFSL